MTRDELLAEINEYIKTCEPDCSSHTIENMPWITLRAVIELPRQNNSKPNDFKMDFANMTPSQIAAECFTWGYATAMNKVIKTIEKELK